MGWIGTRIEHSFRIGRRPSQPTPLSERSHHCAQLVIIGITLVYACGFLLWYSATPLGLYPVLDGREMLVLARTIARGDLAAEAFYRAPLYPAMLALLIELRGVEDSLPLVARVFNGSCHVLNAYLAWTIAAALWRNTRACVVATALVGLNPVLLHFAADPLDITFAVTLMLGGLALGVRSLAATGGAALGQRVAAGLLFGLAVLARPHMLLIALAWPLALALLPLSGSRAGNVLAGLSPVVLVLLAFGGVNYQLAGDFRVLPWQGAYNLWAATKPGAHGRYYEQSGAVLVNDPAANPARVESERLYQIENPGVPAADYGAMSRYWRARAVAAQLGDPLAALSRMAGKTYYLVNNFEQYNNKTYAFHKQRSPWLVINPICWSLILGLGVWGVLLGWRNPATRLITLFGLSYAVGVIAFFVSARFRVPLVPLLAISAGFIGAPRAATTALSPCSNVLAAAVAATVTALSLLPLNAGEAEKTYVQDHLLLSRACAVLGLHADAARAAHAAVSLAPASEAAGLMVCITGFNDWLERGAAGGTAGLDAQCEQFAARSDTAARLAAALHWRGGDTTRAVSTWQRLVDADSSEAQASLAALVVVGRLREQDRTALAGHEHDARADELLLAFALAGDETAARRYQGRHGEVEFQRQIASLRALYGAPDPR